MKSPTPLHLPTLEGLGSMSPKTVLLALESKGRRIVLESGGGDFPRPGSPLCGGEMALSDKGTLFLHFHCLSIGVKCSVLSDTPVPFPKGESSLEISFASKGDSNGIHFFVNPMERIHAVDGVEGKSIGRLLHPSGLSALSVTPVGATAWDIALSIPVKFSEGESIEASLKLSTPSGESLWKGVLRV